MYKQTTLSHSDTMTIINAIYEQATADKATVAVAVVDAHGELLGFIRTDGCRLSSIQIAQLKAYSAAREHITSQELGIRSKTEGFPMTNFGELKYVTWGGGLPITVQGEVVGAVGVSGMSEDADIAYAELGLRALLAE
jgi:glc operon protein GlcG